MDHLQVDQMDHLQIHHVSSTDRSDSHLQKDQIDQIDHLHVYHLDFTLPF